jgi:hypothetical protein
MTPETRSRLSSKIWLMLGLNSTCLSLTGRSIILKHAVNILTLSDYEEGDFYEKDYRYRPHGADVRFSVRGSTGKVR